MTGRYDLPRSMTERNQQDVDLATETLNLFTKIDLTVAQKTTDMRSLLVNLCDMQARFATPMALPFVSGEDDVVHDMRTRLQTPRPFQLLRQIGVLYPCPEDCLAEDIVDCEVGPDGSTFVFCGGDSWERLVARGLLSGADAVPPKDSVWLWLPELFKLFAAIVDQHPDARRLAAAWYYTATEVDFSNDSDDEDAEEDEQEDGGVEDNHKNGVADTKSAAPAVAASSTAAASATTASLVANGDDNDDGENDDDDDDDDDDEFVPGDDEEDEEIADEDEAVDAFTDMADAMATGGRENAIEALGRMMSAAAANGEAVSAAAFEPPEAREARVTILKAVRRMDAYLPSPDSHMPYFKRMLKKISTGGCEEWFPWGTPPLQHMVDLLTKDMSDNEPNNFMRESLAVFAQAQGQ